MTITRFIGDVHGKYERYGRIIADCQNSIQVGDMGVGFRNTRTGLLSANPPYDKMVAGNHRFIRGNHDNPQVCLNHTQWIPDGKVEGDMMFIGGAFSIDRAWRTLGYDWWPDEELSVSAWCALTDLYKIVEPRIMVTHECPESLALTFQDYRADMMPSQTRMWLDLMFKHHAPAIWIHGHWHRSLKTSLYGTYFISLAELEYVDLEISS